MKDNVTDEMVESWRNKIDLCKTNLNKLTEWGSWFHRFCIEIFR